MGSHLKSIAKKKVSDFLLREEGMVGNRSAFATAAFVSTAALATTLLVAPDAGAHPHNCGNIDCVPGQRCCAKYVNLAWVYTCVPHVLNIAHRSS